jgi:hypothetical protein
VQQFTDNPGKRPVATVGFCEELYLRSRVRHQISKVAVPPLSRNDWPAYEYLRDLAQRLRRPTKQAGKSLWPLLFAAACACVFVYFAHPWAKTRVFCSTCTPQTSFRVLKSYNKRDFLMQRVVDGVPEPPEMRRFDEDSPLEMGFTLTYLRFEDRGSVWSVRGIDPYFRLERDRNGMATVPPNCVNVTGRPVVCDGEPQF